jgi:hypothetical protein
MAAVPSTLALVVMECCSRIHWVCVGKPKERSQPEYWGFGRLASFCARIGKNDATLRYVKAPSQTKLMMRSSELAVPAAVDDEAGKLFRIHQFWR